MSGKVFLKISMLVFLVVVLLVGVIPILVIRPVPRTSFYIIRVSGTPGLKFDGQYMKVQPGGSSSSVSVNGAVPAEYRCQGSMVSISFQKSDEAGTLQVSLIKDGSEVKAEETAAPFGIVSMAN